MQEFEKSTDVEPVSAWKERIWEEILHFHPEASGAYAPEPEPGAATRRSRSQSDEVHELFAGYKQAKKDARAAPGDQSLQAAYREKKRRYKRAKDAAESESEPEQEPEPEPEPEPGVAPLPAACSAAAARRAAPPRPARRA